MYRIKARGDETGELVLYDLIGEGWFGGISARQVRADVKALKGVRVLDVRINSDGGDVFEAAAIYQTLVQSGKTVNTYVDGLAASAASVIAMAGERIHIAENGFLMIHNAWTLAMGDAAGLRKTADDLDRVNDSIVQTYAARTGQSQDDITEWMNEETWLSATDAMEKGFATDVMELRAAAMLHDVMASKFRNMPDAVREMKPDAPSLDDCRTKVARNSLTLSKMKLR